MRFIPFILLSLAVSGCTSVDDPFLNAAATKPGGPSLSTSVSKEVALASLPVVGGASSVRQSVQESQAEQVIVYPNATTIPGENVLTVSTREGGKVRRAPTREAVAAEMRKVLPGVRMAINPAIGENAYGVFGYATGALPGSSAGSCLYAWQVTPQQGSQVVAGQQAASIRLRYCSTSNSEEKIVGLMQGLRLKPLDTNTIDGLRMAAATGAGVAVETFAAETAVAPRLARAAAPRNVTVEEQAPVAVSYAPKAIETKVAAAEPVAEKPAVITNAVKVPLPGDAAAIAATEDKVVEPTVKVSANPSKVPLPGTVLIADTK